MRINNDIKKKEKTGRGAVLVLLCILLSAAVLGIYDFFIPDSVSIYQGESVPTFCGTTLEMNGLQSRGFGGSIVKTQGEAKLLGLLPLKTVNVNSYREIKLYPGGFPFGVRLSTSGLLIVGFESVKTAVGERCPAKDAGLQTKDVITHINGKEINTAAALSEAVERCGGGAIEIKYRRGASENTLSVTPALSEDEGKYKTGIWVRDSTAGIGTVTYVVPGTGEFGGLGHGICDADTGELMPMMTGTVVEVSISGIKRGQSGAPGEIRGFLGTARIGELSCNTPCGVFGKYSDMPSELSDDEPLPIALSSEIKEGEAYILSTLENGKREKYKVRISGMNKLSPDGKNFLVEAIDPALIEKSGGIIQGMSGSPIIQDGKLVGAVTHVLINDPCRGYGIFIENMLEAA
ncbi:MAG: SpoIVB peptidase, partial [Clostridia bacterium]|nr:SpoIVB peptidase [Clostridia bacterium]